MPGALSPESAVSTEDTSPAVSRVRRDVRAEDVTSQEEQLDLDPEFDDTVAPSLVSKKQAEKFAKLPEGLLQEFLWTPSPQPHAVRRRAILEKYPEIEKLYGHDPSQAWSIYAAVIIQFFFAYYVTVVPVSTLTYILMTFFISGTLNHILFSAMHEASHRTIYEGKYASEFLCVLVTLPMGVPAGIPFKRYHTDHHIYLGVDVLDPDLPTTKEGWFFQSFLRKLLWIALLPLTYSLRPIFTRPKHVVPMEVVSWISTFVVNFSVAYFWGWKALGYLLIGTFFSMNFHPFAGHFIAEHFIFPDQPDIYQETNSYYGPWNYVTYNLGYHNEHHDFPRIPGSRLPIVRKIAKEFYDIPIHYGWWRVMLRFLFTPTMTPFNRVKRITIKGGPIEKHRQWMVLHDGEVPHGGPHMFWPKAG